MPGNRHPDRATIGKQVDLCDTNFNPIVLPISAGSGRKRDRYMSVSQRMFKSHALNGGEK